MDDRTASQGSVREGVALGAVMHLLGQSSLVLFFTVALGGRVEPALFFAATVIGASQLPYMIPAIVDAGVLRGRARTARGLAIVLLGTLGANLIALRALSPVGLF
jgi:hypothetical protein